MEKQKQILAIGYYHKGMEIIMTSNLQQNREYKQITVAELPITCPMKTRLSYWVTDIETVKINIAARKNLFGTWSAYIGYPQLNDVQESLRSNPLVQYYCSNINNKNDVVSYGDLLDQDTAEYLFPEWKDKKYGT